MQRNKNTVTGLSVRIDDPKDFNRAFRQWKKKVDESKILIEYTEREFYVKPSDARKKSHAAAVARNRKREDAQNLKFQRKY
jgi:ribosomal protein S21